MQGDAIFQYIVDRGAVVCTVNTSLSSIPTSWQGVLLYAYSKMLFAVHLATYGCCQLCIDKGIININQQGLGRSCLHNKYIWRRSLFLSFLNQDITLDIRLEGVKMTKLTASVEAGDISHSAVVMYESLVRSQGKKFG